MVGQVHDDPVEAVRDRRAGRAAGGVVGPEHEVVDKELRAPSEEVHQRGAPLVGLESILLVDPHPRQLLPPPRQVVAAPRELLLRLEQLEPGCEPLFTCPGHVLRHRSSLLSGRRNVDPVRHLVCSHFLIVYREPPTPPWTSSSLSVTALVPSAATVNPLRPSGRHEFTVKE